MDIYYEQAGKGERVIFIHGAGGSTRSWYFQQEALKKVMEVIAVDLPGHGRSAGEGCGTIAQYRDAVVRFLSQRPQGQYFIAGHSMGGAIAMSIAMSHPHLVKGLILVGTGAKLAVQPAILNVREDKARTVRHIIDIAFSAKASPAMKETAFNEMVRCEGETIFRDFSACNDFNVIDSVHTITAPSLVICGRDDLLTPPKYSEFLYRSIANSKLALIEDAGHMVMLERPEAVNREIEEFISVHEYDKF